MLFIERIDKLNERIFSEGNSMHNTDTQNTLTKYIVAADVQQRLGCAWYGEQRRISVERRIDTRIPSESKFSLVKRLKMYIHPRLGVDRRKHAAKQSRSEPLLTHEEIEALIK